MKDTLKALCMAYGATGREETVASVIKDMIAPYVDEIKTDALGNLIGIKRGNGRKVMLAAHMDHIGFVVTDIDEKGFLRVHNAGGIRKLNSLNRHVVFENGVSGILSHEVLDHDLSADQSMRKLFIDIGAPVREEAESKIQRGDIAVYAPDVFEVGGDLLAGPAMDNRAGCALLAEALKALGETPNEIAAVFTSQEEVGLRGARAAAYDLSPDIGIALDVTLCGDTPKGHVMSVKLGGGIAIKIMDNSLICHPGVVKKLEAAAERAGAKCQREVLTAGGTDAGAIQLTKGGIPAGVLSIPCRYVHSAAETVCISDMEEGVKLLVEFLRSDDI
jgi:endoglucanase